MARMEEDPVFNSASRVENVREPAAKNLVVFFKQAKSFAH
jgi:hypothetical protein